MPPEAHLCTVPVISCVLCMTKTANVLSLFLQQTNKGSYWWNNNLAMAVNLISCLLFCDSKINVCDEEEKNTLIQWFTSIKLTIFSFFFRFEWFNAGVSLTVVFIVFSLLSFFFFRFEWFDTGASSTVVLFVLSLFQGKDLFVSF